MIWTMRPERLHAVLLEGHKEAAFEVPFDPAERWAVLPCSSAPARRGHRVRAMLNGVTFDGALMGRSKRFWLPVPARSRRLPVSRPATRPSSYWKRPAGRSLPDGIAIAELACEGEPL
ncbi:MAG: hypothetical protein JWN02_894 [Acidobacteria bacterium]|nr:hypothetical protein [Acidobacteriota bacterium]